MVQRIIKKHMLTFRLFFKILTFILITWKFIYHYDDNKISQSLVNGEKLNTSLHLSTHRSLAKYEKQNEFMNERFHYKTENNRETHNLVNRRNNNTYEHLKRSKPNNVDNYLNSFKHRHSKKGRLKKFDSYYEKKLFKSLDKIAKLTEEKDVTRKRIKKILYKKYGLPLIIITLLPLLVFILPSMLTNGNHTKSKCQLVLKLFRNKKDGPVIRKRFHGFKHGFCRTIPYPFIYLYYIFFVLFSLLIVSFIVYTYIKVMKFHRIKSGMLK
ncbi:Plasmodium exported protein, unknown function [Plasmodium vivax]|uniref:Fam-l protein n=1 Tax=Plasmodium vivax TaxID=5855 RepID=A0A565A4T0_PLAVI|nr:Plasmodium exported protein, unknown function [Plasmodium vivax]